MTLTSGTTISQPIVLCGGDVLAGHGLLQKEPIALSLLIKRNLIATIDVARWNFLRQLQIFFMHEEFETLRSSDVDLPFDGLGGEGHLISGFQIRPGA